MLLTALSKRIQAILNRKNLSHHRQKNNWYRHSKFSGSTEVSEKRILLAAVGWTGGGRDYLRQRARRGTRALVEVDSEAIASHEKNDYSGMNS